MVNSSSSSEFDEYRFVAKDGQATEWRPLPKEGIQVALHKAKALFGDQQINLELRK
jgi:hypothetical protein